ncbi:hypothetical protein HOY34_08220 [Xinfangfangia sp. D13-10-4-6]|uniref:hypothetical protein n=1 Tax=Pseudogemmobacter hezensis TaxID=2737662 RepID=UPI0015524C5A|nr:hypothetical protein [Pseudogemmobacter hezensis]NPD15184.1 hypothetical protein [Pseudogemmobacter hezensis]
MRVCIISNSHAAALKQGIDELESRQIIDGLDLHFFASPANTLEDTALLDGKIVPTTDTVKKSFEISSGGLHEIVISDYDAFVVHGVFVYEGAFRALMDAEKGATFYSQAVLNELDPFNKTISSRIYRQIRTVSDADIIVSARPYLAIKPTDTPRDVVARDRFRAYINERFRAMHKLHAFFQPEETVTGGVFTKSEFNQGAKRGDDRYPDFQSGDGIHMNGAYGIHYIAALSQLLRSL